jgi:uncharacterized protein YidB (DUF937 family)
MFCVRSILVALCRITPSRGFIVRREVGAMSLLDQILGSVGATGSQAAGAQPTGAPPAGASTATPPPQQAHSMLESALALINSPKIGGLPGLMKLCQEKGLGNLISGWVGTGPNPPISPSQLQQTVGDEHIQQFAQQTGMSQDQAASTLSQLLPHVVDQLTPQGTVPQQGLDFNSALATLKSKFLQ